MNGFFQTLNTRSGGLTFAKRRGPEQLLKRYNQLLFVSALPTETRGRHGPGGRVRRVAGRTYTQKSIYICIDPAVN